MTKNDLAVRYGIHRNSIPRSIREGNFPSASIWVGDSSPRWSNIEQDRWDEIVAATGDRALATRIVLAEREKRLAELKAT